MRKLYLKNYFKQRQLYCLHVTLCCGPKYLIILMFFASISLAASSHYSGGTAPSGSLFRSPATASSAAGKTVQTLGSAAPSAFNGLAEFTSHSGGEQDGAPPTSHTIGSFVFLCGGSAVAYCNCPNI